MHSSGSISARRTSVRRPASPGSSANAGERLVDLGGVARDQRGRHDVGELLAEEVGHRGEHPALLGDGLVHDHVEGAQPVRGHHQEAVLADVVQVADLARCRCARPSRHHSDTIASRKRPRCRSTRSRSKAASSSRGVQRDLGVGLEDLAERAALLGGGRGVALDDPVRRVAVEARVDEREEHRLGEDEAERADLEVSRGARLVDHEPLGERRGLAQQEAGQQERVGQHHALDRAVRDVALVPQRDVLEARHEVAAHARGPGRTAARR